MNNNNTQQQQQQQPQLCIDCNQFYGNPANENLCSSCYKKKMIKNNNNSQQNNLQGKNLQTEQNNQQEISTVQQQKDQQQDEQKQENEPTKPQQTDLSKCWNCSKKVGLLGVKCKCNYIYCNKHRMPENHNCDFNFAQLGKEQLKIANPNIQKAKLEKI